MSTTAIAQPRPLLALVDALNPAAAAAIIERATVYPWIVEAVYSPTTGLAMTKTVVVRAPLHEPPDPHDLVPEGAMLLRGEVYPASKLDDMPPASRRDRISHFIAMYLHRKALIADKPVDELKGWLDFDPIHLDEETRRWANPGVRFTGN